MDTFSLSEILQMAEEIERNGYKFYRQSAEAVKDQSTKEVMQDLAEKEKVHEAFFREMREQFCRAEDLSTIDMDGQVAMHIQLMADTHVFNLNKETAKLVASVQSSQSLLKLAIGFEKDTIIFFNALKEAAAEKNLPKIDVMIKEEVDHIRILKEAMDNLGEA